MHKFITRQRPMRDHTALTTFSHSSVQTSHTHHASHEHKPSFHDRDPSMGDPLTNAAIGWGFSAAGWLLSPILTRFLNKCFDALSIDPPPHLLRRKQALLEKLDKLQTSLLPQIHILTEAAQKSTHRDVLKQWLQKLRYAFYEAEHVLGLVEYKRLEREVNSLFPSNSKFNLKKLKNRLKISSEEKDLIKSLESLEKTVNEAMGLVGLLDQPSSGIHNSTRRTNVLGEIEMSISNPGTVVIGRDNDRDDIVKLLREDPPKSSSNAKCYSVIGIWGMGGSGKTTLAQYVCEYEKEANYFDLVIWAHVSREFSVHAIWERIWESAFKEPCPHFSSPEGLQSKLEEKLRGQKFLLVLDDAWCDKGVSDRKVEQLFAPLRAGKRGSKVLVTTRMEEAAKVLGAMNPIPLRELDDEQFLSLFMRKALGDARIRDNHVEESLLSIGKQIVAKLFRSPLAATAVAGQLCRRLDPDFWSSMLNRSGLLKDTMGALYFSYQHLPPPLQRCFAFYSLFPKGYKFEHDRLINLWIAEGFIEDEGNNEHIKDIANRYILELVSSSFFQVDKWDRYSMHDLMHDLAEHVSEGECCRIESGDKKEIPTQTRHIFVDPEMLIESMEYICQLNYLCTIIVGSPSFSDFYLEKVNLEALFMKSRKLHVVDIQDCRVKGISESVVHLRNLRYFVVIRLEDVALHNSINRLYHLCVLHSGRNHISNVGRLISLHHLEELSIEKTSGFELKQLEHLTNLFGSLSIHGLENVESKEEANQAKLQGKRYLDELHFYWDYYRELDMRDIDVGIGPKKDIDVGILEGLCPPPHIKFLSIDGYVGERLPSWITEKDNNLIHLKNLELTGCRGLKTLEGIKYLSSLLSLTISFLPRLNIWEPLPLNVTRLELSKCLSLAFVCNNGDLDVLKPTGRSSMISQIVTFMENLYQNYEYFGPIYFQFERVREMMRLDDHTDDQAIAMISKDLGKCLEKRLDLICQLTNKYDKLSLPPELKKLSITSCFITDKILEGSLQVLTSLTNLTLEDIITITCIPREVLGSLKNLSFLCIIGCLLLTSVGGWDTHRTLKKLNIQCCPSLIFGKSVAANSSSTLETVSFDGCKPLDDTLQGLCTLESLDIWNCPTIENLCVSHLKSLRNLAVRDCANLVSLRGFIGLTNLKYLKVLGCQKFECYSDADKVPQLYDLQIDRLSLVEQLVSTNGLSSLLSLELHGSEQEAFSQEECMVLYNLSSLEFLHFSNCKLRSFPSLLCLRSLKLLSISSCKYLNSLPELPPSIKTFKIHFCNDELTRSCQDRNHQNWHKINHIPEKVIEFDVDFLTLLEMFGKDNYVF